MAKITTRGYILKTQNEYFADQVALYRSIDVQWNLDPSTPDGLKIAHDAEVFGALDEALLQAYLSKDPATATGLDLDIVANLTDTQRESGTRSYTEVKLTGVPGTIIDRGKRISSRTTGQRWVLSQGWVLDDRGEAFAEVYSESIGMIEADANTLTQIVDSVGGWTGVTNPNVATVGQNAQSDGQLRLSRMQQVAQLGLSKVDSMKSALYAVHGVKRVEVYENDTDEVDEIGLPAHSTCVLVHGGELEEIAEVLYEKRCPGTLQFIEPSTQGHTVNVASKIYPKSKQQPLKFARPVAVPIKMICKIKDDGTLPPNVADIVESAILEFTNGELLTSDIGFKQAGFDIGESVPITTMMTPVNKIIGSYGNSYIDTMSINGKTTGQVEISPFQLSTWISTNITVEVI